ncbi:MAG: hypothetical protein KDB79_05975 [Acidobacteria bacterium]|nr:hypothetical protein [Acidobacteriota bacterium]
MKQVIQKFIYLLCLSALLIQAVFPQCEIKVGKGESATKWNEDFTQNGPGKGLEPATGPGWTGADSTFSLELPNGDSAFFFSDSFIGEYPEKPGDGRVYVDKNGLRMRQPNCIPPICGPKPEHIHYVYNSIVIPSKDGKTLKTLVGEKDKNGYSTAYFKPKSNDPNVMFWLGDPFWVEVNGEKKIWIFLNEWRVARPFDKSFFLDFRGQSIAQLNADTLEIESQLPLQNLVDQGVWGIATWLDGSDLYIYGMKNDGDIENARKSDLALANKYKKLYVAKTDISKGLKSVADQKNWRAWNGKKWVKGLQKRVSIIPEKDSISDELSIKRLNINGKPVFVMVTFNTAVGYYDWKDLYLYSSCLPQGPFKNKYFFYSTPTSGQTKLKGMTDGQSLQSGLSVYNPHMHPQFTKDGKLLISYNSNLPFGAKPGDSIYADFYKPRFVWVPIEGLK